MSSPRRALAALGVALALAAPAVAGLTACGFEPVYGTKSQVRHPELAAIDVGPIRGSSARIGRISVEEIDRVGQELRNDLIEILGSARTEPRYRLEVKLQESQTELAVQADDKVTRYDLTLGAEFGLLDIKSGKVVYFSQTHSISSYNIVDSEFATVASQKNARTRAARDVADNIRDLLIVYFSRDPQATVTP